MILIKNKAKKILFFFLFAHVIVWTLAPTFSNINLPLDTIEVLVWGNELQLGYDKYPPIFPLFTEFFFIVFGNQDWAYYFLSQLFVVSSFYIIFNFANFFFKDKNLCLISVLLLETIYFFNYTTPELNAFLCQFPFLAATVFYCWKAINSKNYSNWIIFGILAGISTLIFYLSLYLLAAIGIYFLYKINKEKKFSIKYLLTIFAYLIVVSPHIYWIVTNDLESVKYALFRSFGDPLSGISSFKIADHLLYPLIFLVKQTFLLIPFFILLKITISNFKIRINFKDQKLIFLFCITLLPLILMFLTSFFFVIRVRTMWMTTFYLFPGIFFIYLCKLKLKIVNFKKFLIIISSLLIILPSVYSVQSFLETDKRTDFPGRKVAIEVQTIWNENFNNPIEIVVGKGWMYGEWYAGNLSYYLKDRPKLRNEYKKYNNKGTIWVGAQNEIKNCNGYLYQVKQYYDICMLGVK